SRSATAGRSRCPSTACPRPTRFRRWWTTTRRGSRTRPRRATPSAGSSSGRRRTSSRTRCRRTWSPRTASSTSQPTWASAAAGPGGDRSGFDPEGVYQSLREDAPSFGLFSGGGIFGVLRTLSFWRMKDRARWFGERIGAKFLARMMQAAPRNLRFHLMGHSFGCIVVSATLAGPKGRGRVARPVDSLALVQGALSIWSYCDDIPATPGQPGYFNKVFSDKRVRGPILSTQSVFDTATGKWYPLGAGVARQVAFAAPGELPKFGALGAHGIRGPGTNGTHRPVLPVSG